MSSNTVYILGAGCSVKYGYPLAANFVPAFETFSGSLGEGAQKLKHAVDETVMLMREAKVQTVDELVFRIHNSALDDPRQAKDVDADKSKLGREIDELVYALYGLTPEEIKIVEDAK